MKPRVAVIGLDCAAPQLMFDAWLDDLPNIKSLVERGAWGRLKSIDPPITVPAWSCMFSSRDPGQLGIYGFRNRKDYSYDGLAFANADSVTVERVWDILSGFGKHVTVLSVPQTYPPHPVRGELVGCFLTPDTHVNEFTYPPELKTEISTLIGGDYIVDVKNFRSDDRDRILDEIYEMTDQRFDVADHLLSTRDWDFFAMVEIGMDRIHHAFWSFLDPTHSKYEPGNEYEGVIREYYVHVDEQIGRLMRHFDEQTTVFIVSDHGAQKMDGGICVNEWLLQNGYLALEEPPESPVPIGKARVDWSRTQAWGEGGYYCRLFLNVKGREPEGVIEPEVYERVRDELKEKLEALGDPEGNPIGTKVFRPEELWPERNGIVPDLIIYWGNLYWRSVGTVGGGKVHTYENDTGPDDANHSPEGVFVMAGPGAQPGKL
ncbi:MAG: alkaline phosphatase family protein, partial [Armatimonadetes bacterium]|nr:alkaline phosphatase family protein [Armatimonadota bacterium]